MSRQTVNDTFSLQIPERFEPMSAENLRELSRNGGDPFRWGVRDRENHVIIAALWKPYPVFLVRLASLKSIARRNAQLAGKAYAGHNYRLLGFCSMQAGDEKAEGYRFRCSVDGAAQAMNCYLLRDGGTVYAFLCAGRENNAAADQSAFREMLESLQHV